MGRDLPSLMKTGRNSPNAEMTRILDPGVCGSLSLLVGYLVFDFYIFIYTYKTRYFGRVHLVLF